MTDADTDEQDELEAQFRTATEELQRTVMRLFQDRDIHPHAVMLKGSRGRLGKRSFRSKINQGSAQRA